MTKTRLSVISNFPNRDAVIVLVKYLKFSALANGNTARRFRFSPFPYYFVSLRSGKSSNA